MYWGPRELRTWDVSGCRLAHADVLHHLLDPVVQDPDITERYLVGELQIDAAARVDDAREEQHAVLSHRLDLADQRF